MLLILGSILLYFIYESYNYKFEKVEKVEKIEKKDIDNNSKYYSNDIHMDKVLSDKLKISGTLEEEQVNSMKINYYKNDNFNNTAMYEPILPSLEGTSNIED